MKSSNQTWYSSPVGILHLKTDGESLTAAHFSDAKPALATHPSNHLVIRQAITQLDEYFEGKRAAFDLPLAPDGTDFQQSVWKKLQEIPFGQTITYGELAEMLGDVNKVRAVGKANGKNPIPVIIPCHRVIGANNKLVGYGGGIENKRWLLQHEGALLL
ncbi:MAG TPA: methylated-DNA--[protein]-cysteine S-methyltransferase [Balneolaceae bacterium]|nr:methylated-DNA--[protein]-cysteine S-methyltransferase [Balneolaceae bacterium]